MEYSSEIERVKAKRALFEGRRFSSRYARVEYSSEIERVNAKRALFEGSRFSSRYARVEYSSDHMLPIHLLV